jgi:hypothetical protein
MMVAAHISEIENYFTRQYIPEDKSELHTRRRENLKSHITPNIRTVAMFLTVSVKRISNKTVGMFTIYLQNKFHSPTFKGSLIITTKLKLNNLQI